jgi:uncharacterized phage protein gp47/JayE
MALISITIPSLSDVLTGVKRAFNAEFRPYGLDAFQANNLLYPLTTVTGHLIAQLWARMREFASQATPMGATGSNLDAWLSLFGVTVPAAAKATGTVSVTGQNEAEIAEGTALTRIDGLVFITTAAVAFGVAEETIVVAVEAEELGSEYNTDVGTELELALVASDDIDPTAVVVSITGGSDPADPTTKIALLQSRLSQGQAPGTVEFYRLLALGFSASISRVFVEPAGLGPGTVVVFFVNRNPDGSDDDVLTLPSEGEIAALLAYLDQDTVRRVNDRLVVRAPTLVAVDMEIAITPNTAEVQAAIEASLRARFLEDYDTGGYTIPNSEISGAISGADGEISHTVLDVGGDGASADAVALFGEILQVGTITFSAE